MKIGSFVTGVVIGGIVTGVAVALTTPKKGGELRDDIKGHATVLYNDSMENIDDVKVKTTSIYNEKKEQAKVTTSDLNDKVHQKKNKINKKIAVNNNKKSEEVIGAKVIIDEIPASKVEQ